MPHSRLLAALQTAAAWVAVPALTVAGLQAAAWCSRRAAPPLDRPLSLAPRGSVAAPIRVRVRGTYELHLAFRRPDTTRAQFRRVSTLVGEAVSLNGGAPSTGIPIPIRWSLHDRDTGRLVAGATTTTSGAHGWYADAIHRRVAVLPDLADGEYEFRAAVLADVPEFSGVHARIQMYRPSK